jgi:hypothetical protein
VLGGGASERSDEVEELAAVCESSSGMVGIICGESKSISPSECMRGEPAPQKDEALVTDDVSSDKITTSSSLSESSSELTSRGLDVRGALSRPRGGMYGGKGVLRR